MTDTMLQKISHILNQAENASTEAEADAFFKKAQQLSTKYSIELATARSHVAKLQKREEPEMRTIDIGSSGQHNLPVFCDLFMRIGKLYDIQFNISHKSLYVVAFGMPSDIELTETFYASIVGQMTQAANEFIRSGGHKSEIVTVWSHRKQEYVTKPIDGRIAKRNFFDSFISRVMVRLRDAQREAQHAIISEEREQLDKADEWLSDTEQGSEPQQTSTELVLADKKEEIAQFYSSASTARGTYRGYRTASSYSETGRNAGRAAGDKARLGGEKSLPGGRKAIG